MGTISAVGFESEDLRDRAKQWADLLNLKLDNTVFPRLCVTRDKLVLMLEHFSPLYADFSATKWQKRRDAGKKQGLIRACKPAPGVRVLDTTGGWGRDAAVMASFGASVMMLERSPVMAALLSDALQRLDEQAVTFSLSKSSCGLSLLCIDAKDYLQSLAYMDYPEVIYIDPMHPTRQKSALVKKDMQALQQCIGADDDAEALIQLSMTRAVKRVVVKWPQRLAPFMKPSMSIEGKTVRFDIYLMQ